MGIRDRDKPCQVTVTGELAVNIIVLVVDVLVVVIEDSVGRRSELIEVINGALDDSRSVGLTNNVATVGRNECHAVLTACSNRDDVLCLSDCVALAAHARTHQDVINIDGLSIIKEVVCTQDVRTRNGCLLYTLTLPTNRRA